MQTYIFPCLHCCKHIRNIFRLTVRWVSLYNIFLYSRSPRKHETYRFLYLIYALLQINDRARLNIWIKTVSIILIFNLFVLIEGSFNLIRINIQNPHVVFQVSWFWYSLYICKIQTVHSYKHKYKFCLFYAKRPAVVNFYLFSSVFQIICLKISTE